MSCEDSCWTWERRSAALERFTAAALSSVFTSSPIQASRSCLLLNCEDLPCFWYRACAQHKPHLSAMHQSCGGASAFAQMYCLTPMHPH